MIHVILLLEKPCLLLEKIIDFWAFHSVWFYMLDLNLTLAEMKG